MPLTALPLRRRPLGKTEHREAEALADGLSRVNWEVRYEYEDGAPFPGDLVFLQETHSVFQANAICGRCVYSSSSQPQPRVT